MTTHLSYIRIAFAGVLLLAITACAQRDQSMEFYDPHEERNRSVHEANKELDRGTVSPVANVYGKVIPPEVDTVIGNTVDNLGLPGDIANSILQLDLKNAGIATLRFVVNSTLGMGGIADPASELGLRHTHADFGQTLYVWGVPEGSYQELPGIGPSTQRGTAGMVVDVFLNPVGHLLPSNVRPVTPALSVMEKLGDRNQYDSLISEVLYNSEDSYAAARLYYLQSRRRALSGEVADIDLEDPYAQ